MEKSQIHQVIYNILTSCMNSKLNQTAFPSDETIIKIIKAAQNIFKKESSLLKLQGNFVVVGDIHGNIDDLLRIFEKRGYPPTTNYLFLGDYVDRGTHSIEVIILLFCLKILYPDSLYMIRGNHECQSVTTVYGFKKDCSLRFKSSDDYSGFSIYEEGNKVYKKFMKCFMYLSYVAVINDSYFCVHGGISPYLESLDDIDELYKPMISADSELATDLVWSDPLKSADGFQHSTRGAGYYFNDKKLNKFLKRNGLKKLIRSHESCMDGVDFPLENCVTVFSNTDYCGMYNKMAIAIINQDSNDFSSESSPSASNSSDDSGTEDSLSVSDDSHKINCISTMKFEFFDPLSGEELKKRRVIIPEWIFTEDKEDLIPIKDSCAISPQDLLDVLSTPVALF